MKKPEGMARPPPPTWRYCMAAASRVGGLSLLSGASQAPAGCDPNQQRGTARTVKAGHTAVSRNPTSRSGKVRFSRKRRRRRMLSPWCSPHRARQVSPQVKTFAET